MQEETITPQWSLILNPEDFTEFYYPEAGDIVTIRDEPGRWRVAAAAPPNGQDCVKLINVDTGKEHDSLYDPALLQPIKQKKPRAIHRFGAMVNQEVWEQVTQRTSSETLCANVAHLLQTGSDEEKQLLTDALAICARHTQVARHFPEISHVCTPEAINCMIYRVEVMFNHGCDCCSEDGENWDTDACPKWQAIHALHWVRQLAKSSGRSPKQFHKLCYFLTIQCSVPELNIDLDSPAPEENQEDRIRYLKSRLSDLLDEGESWNESEVFQLKREIHELERALGADDWPEVIGDE
jgi:hypothetical protein